jgi:hypothetical protein
LLTHTYREVLNKRRKEKARAKMLIVAREVLYSPELMGQIFSHLRESRALQRASLVCQRWYLEASRFLWAVRRQLSGLEHHIPAAHQKLIASFIRHLDLSLINQLWEGSPLSMPTLVGLQIAILNTKVIQHQSGAQCLQKMLVGCLRELCIETSTDDNLGSLELDTCWFRTLRLSCSNLVVLSLNIELPSSARDQLELFLLDARIQHLALGPLLNESLDDWSVALILAQQSLVTLEIHKPVTKQGLDILQQQCHENTMLSTTLLIRTDLINKELLNPSSIPPASTVPRMFRALTRVSTLEFRS